jgi:hypothetical protein
MTASLSNAVEMEWSNVCAISFSRIFPLANPLTDRSYVLFYFMRVAAQ